jgi:GNAT superfamily N-acetyltransferase
MLPEYQGQTIGTKIMKYIAQHSKAKNVLFHSFSGKEGIYQKLSYREIKPAMALFADPENYHRLGYME